MLDELQSNLVTDPTQPSAPPYRPFRERPTGLYIQAVADKIAETGQPELIAGLYRGKIDRAEDFFILRKIYINRKKRPNGDMAPCPRCGCDDKFLRGVLAWFPGLQCCAVIGHCCADHETLDAAEREYKWRQRRDYQEDYLLAGIPLLATKRALLTQFRPSANEALRVYREFRRDAPEVHQHLRDLKAQRGGELKLVQILRSAEDDHSDYVGPTGFRARVRGGSEVESRDIDFGSIAGQTAVERDFNPIKILDDAIRTLDSFGDSMTEEQALELIVGMDERHRGPALAIVQSVDRKYAKLAGKLANFWQFFTRENIERLSRYGRHRENHFPFEASYREEHGRRTVVFGYRRERCRLVFADKFAAFSVDWPQ